MNYFFIYFCFIVTFKKNILPFYYDFWLLHAISMECISKSHKLFLTKTVQHVQPPNKLS